jgi:hypothetical protein
LPGISCLVVSAKGFGVRSIELDVLRDLCEVAIAEAGAVRFAERAETTPGTR